MGEGRREVQFAALLLCPLGHQNNSGGSGEEMHMPPAQRLLCHLSGSAALQWGFPATILNYKWPLTSVPEQLSCIWKLSKVFYFSRRHLKNPRARCSLRELSPLKNAEYSQSGLGGFETLAGQKQGHWFKEESLIIFGWVSMKVKAAWLGKPG